MRMVGPLGAVLVTLLCIPGGLVGDGDRSDSVDLFESDSTTPSWTETALRPLENPLGNLRAAASGGASLSIAGQSAPRGLPFGLLSLANPDAEYVLFVESRESIKKDFLTSVRIRHPLIELDAGSRWLPGPRTNFLADPDARSAFATPTGGIQRDLGPIPNGRRYPAYFGRVPLGVWMPGIFTIRGAPETDTGFYFASNNLLFAVGRRRGALALGGPLALPGDDPFAYATIDLERTRELRQSPTRGDQSSDAAWRLQAYTSHAGYARLVADRSPKHFLAIVEGERRVRWDYADFAAHQVEPGRGGRSGLGAVSLRWFDVLETEAAGQDRGPDGFRVGGFAFAPRLGTLLPGPAWPGRLLLGARSYNRSRYGMRARSAAGETNSVASQAPGRDAGRDSRRKEFSAGGLGYRWIRPGGGLEVYGEARRHGGRVMQLRIHLGPGTRGEFLDTAPESTDAPGAPATAAIDPAIDPAENTGGGSWSFTAALVYGHLPASPGEFLLLRAPAEQGAGVRFFGEETGALILHLRGEFFALYWESRLELRTGRAATFANLQFRTRF